MTTINRRTRRLPFLHRNWTVALNALQMGNKVSSPFRQAGDEDDYLHRPLKRRRLSLGSADGDSAPHVNDIEGYLLPEDPPQPQRGLRIEILRIVHKDSSRVRSNPLQNGSVAPNVKDVSTTKARCRITVYCRHGHDRKVLHCDSQLCTINTFKNPVGPSVMGRVRLPQPFHIPTDKILVEREDEAVFHLADAYTIVVELESSGDAQWPPLNLAMEDDEQDGLVNRSTRTRHWSLSGTVDQVFTQPRKTVKLHLLKDPFDALVSPRATEFVMDIDVRWASGFSDKAVRKRLEKDMLPSITVFDPNEELPFGGVANSPLGDGHTNGHLANGLSPMTSGLSGETIVDDDDGAEGDLTPNRSRRVRKVTNYNLKLLSDQAAGKEARRRRKLEGKAPPDEGRISYVLPPEHFIFDDFGCAICGALNQSISQLRAHVMSHDAYAFDFEPRGRGGYQVTVTHQSGASGSPIRTKVYQLGKPMKPFDLDQFVLGDDSWVTSRLGPDNDGAQVLQKVRQPRKAPAQKLIPRRRDKKILVPNNKQPMYDPLSKAQMEPGTEVRPYVADDTWLVQKHRDMLQEFVDVNPAEKEFIREWDAYMGDKRVLSDYFLPRAYLGFAKDKASWIVAKPWRAEEFGKHSAVLLARNVIDAGVLSDALQRISEARQQRSGSFSNANGVGLNGSETPQPMPPVADVDGDVPMELVAPTASPRQGKSSNGCTMCGLPVLGPNLLVCSNQECKKPLYHDTCAQKDANMSVESRKWRCNDCFAS